MLTAYVVIKNGNIFMGATVNKQEAINLALKEGDCQVIESKATRDSDGKLKLLNIKSKNLEQ